MSSILQLSDVETLSDLKRLSTEEQFNAAARHSVKAKSCGNAATTGREYGRKRYRAVLALLRPRGAELEVATDNKSLMSVRYQNRSLHLTRQTAIVYPKLEGYFVMATAGLQSISDRLNRGQAPSYSEQGQCFDLLDRIGRTSDVRLVEKHVRNATTYLRAGETGGAVLEFKIALRWLQGLEQTERQKMAPRATERQLLRSALLRVHAEAEVQRITIRSVLHVFDAVDVWPETTGRIVPVLRIVQELARETVPASRALEVISRQLLRVVPWN